MAAFTATSVAVAAPTPASRSRPPLHPIFSACSMAPVPPFPSFRISAASQCACIGSRRSAGPSRSLAAAAEGDYGGAVSVLEVEAGEAVNVEEESVGGAEEKERVRPFELYVCNLPRSCEESQLLDVFKPFGAVISAEVSRNNETGISKGCAFVSMTSVSEAKAAMAALDGSDLEGREIRVKYSTDMLLKGQKRKTIVETPHKMYVGNLSWSVTAEDLREHFSQFGTIISTKLLHDRKQGKHRVYAFVSFSTADELAAAVSSNGTELLGRAMMIREAAKS